MRNAATSRIKKLITKAEGALENVRGLLNGKEQGRAVVTLVIAGFLVVSMMAVVVVTVNAAGEANRSSSAAGTVEGQQNELIDDDTQDTAGQQPLTAGSDPDNSTEVCPVDDGGINDGTCGGCTDKCSL